MDSLNATSFSGNGNVVVKGFNLISDSNSTTTDVYFTNLLKNNVTNEVTEVGKGISNEYQTTAYAPIYKYDVKYENRDDAGYFVFTRGTDSNNSDNFNPAVLSSSVVAQAGAQSAMNQGMYYAFEHSDTFMNNSFMERQAMIHKNEYAIASTDYNQNLVIDLDHQNKGVWVKPYSTFESIDLKHGPKVDAINYGTIVGFDSEIHKLKKGWVNVGTAYIGYNGSQLKYNGIDVTTNGGILGLTETFYKGNFWTAITATAGAGVAEASTMYGHEDMTSLMTGVASKTGYNLEFKEGKFIIQPRLFVSYSFINTFDYRNAAGVKIDSDPLHTIQLNPSVKFIGNIKGWQPYASVGMVWNLLNETQATANGVKLPEMHVKPYVEYGVGLQKCWNDKYSAYGQAMLRNGGRTGIALSFGFRVALGGRGKYNENVTPRTSELRRGKYNEAVAPATSSKKVIKELSMDKKAKLMGTSRTASLAMVNKI